MNTGIWQIVRDDLIAISRVIGAAPDEYGIVP
jgi:hypothetical protein